MKYILISLLFAMNAQAAFMGGTLKNSKTDEQIGIECIDANCEMGFFSLNGTRMNPQFDLDLTDMNDLYYHFNMLTTVASTSRVPIPQIWHIMNMQKVTKILRKAFPLMVDKSSVGQFEKMDHKNFHEVMKAIQSY
jgi:hypothetical protein